MGNNKLDQWMQSVEAMSSIKIDHAVPPPPTSKPETSKPKTSKPAAVSDQGLQDQVDADSVGSIRIALSQVFDDAAVTKGENVHGPKLACTQRGSRGLEERQHAVTCRKLILFLIGIAVIVICADLYALIVSVPSASGTDTVLTFRPHTLMLLFGCFLLVVLGNLLTCAACENGMLDGKEAVEAERVLQELCRDTKSDASLAIPVAPFTCIGPSRSLARDCLVSTWAPPVGGGATAYHLQWREQSEQEWVEWASSVASEKIGEPYYCTEGNLRTHTAYQFRVRAFSAVSQRWGPWSPPSKPTTVRHGKGGIILRIVRRLVSLVLLDGLALLSLHLWVVFDAITKSRDSDSYGTLIDDDGTLIDDERFSRF
jgi:hypothetical protein